MLSKKMFYNIAAIVLALLFMASCNAYSSHAQKDPHKIWRYESFGKVSIERHAKAMGCDKISGLHHFTCKDVINNFPEGIIESGIGSSIVVAHYSEKTYLLTARHTCMPGKYKVIALDIPDIELHIRLEIDNRLTVIDYFGNERPATIHAYSKTHDICVISTDNYWGEPVPIAKRMPQIGSDVYNVSAPLGIFGTGMVPMFHGTYIGHIDDNHFYTIPVKPGSSGSAVLNGKGEIVGIVIGAFDKIENIGVAVSLDAVNDMMGKIEMNIK